MKSYLTTIVLAVMVTTSLVGAARAGSLKKNSPICQTADGMRALNSALKVRDFERAQHISGCIFIGQTLRADLKAPAFTLDGLQIMQYVIYLPQNSEPMLVYGSLGEWCPDDAGSCE